MKHTRENINDEQRTGLFCCFAWNNDADVANLIVLKIERSWLMLNFEKNW